MTKPLLSTLAALLLAACATSAAPTTGMTTTPVASSTLPRLRAPAQLADSGSLNQRIAAWHGGAVTADVRVCVAPDGSVADVELSKSSGLTVYDRAVVTGASRWSYEPFAADAPRCDDVAVAYVVK